MTSMTYALRDLSDSLSSAEKDRSGGSEVELELPVPLTCGELFARDLGRTLEEE
jgi:hypothetical protein